MLEVKDALFQWRIDLGSVIELIAFVFGGIAFVIAIKYDVRSLKQRLTDLEKSVLEMTKTLTSVLISDARTDARLQNLENKEEKGVCRPSRNGRRKPINN